MTNPTGSNEHEANGERTTVIAVVDGADGLTPDMLRGPNRGWSNVAGIPICYRNDVPPGIVYATNRQAMRQIREITGKIRMIRD